VPVEVKDVLLAVVVGDFTVCSSRKRLIDVVDAHGGVS
jgi:hypothetical protein